MAKIFLDANFFIDIVEERQQIRFQDFKEDIIFISPLSVHIVSYLYKYRMPKTQLKDFIPAIKLVPFDTVITVKAIDGPTTDFEDNVQLHSAAQSACDIFLTRDKKLLEMRFFGKVKIEDTITHR